MGDGGITFTLSERVYQLGHENIRNRMGFEKYMGDQETGQGNNCRLENGSWGQQEGIWRHTYIHGGYLCEYPPPPATDMYIHHDVTDMRFNWSLTTYSQG